MPDEDDGEELGPSPNPEDRGGGEPAIEATTRADSSPSNSNSGSADESGGIVKFTTYRGDAGGHAEVRRVVWRTKCGKGKPKRERESWPEKPPIAIPEYSKAQEAHHTHFVVGTSAAHLVFFQETTRIT